MRPSLAVGVAGAVAVLVIVTTGPVADDGALVQRIDAVASSTSSYSLFVHHEGETWFQPLAIYPSVLLMKAGVPRVGALAMPGAIAALLTLVLTSELAARASLSRTHAVLAAVFLLLTPGFVALARSPGADLLLVVMVLAWCVAVVEHAARPRRWLPIAGGAALAMSAYTQPAGVWTAPIFFALGAVLWRRAHAGWRAIGLAAVAILVTWLPIVIWLLRHPDFYQDTFGRWAIHAAHVRNPLDGLVAFSRWHVAARRVNAYWDYVSPTFLFASGQLFALWAAVVVPLGLWAAARQPRSDARALVIAAVAAAPVAAVLLDVDRSAALVPTLIPFAAVLAATAVASLGEMPRFARFAAAVATTALAVLELTRPGK
jgi:4-amino-4-deoxy-L-arabinose transferase-like glycosyltransferase